MLIWPFSPALAPVSQNTSVALSVKPSPHPKLSEPGPRLTSPCCVGPREPIKVWHAVTALCLGLPPHSRKLHEAGVGVSLVPALSPAPRSGAWQRLWAHSVSAGRPAMPVTSSIRSYSPVPSSSILLLWLEGRPPPRAWISPLIFSSTPLRVHPLSRDNDFSFCIRLYRFTCKPAVMSLIF